MRRGVCQHQRAHIVEGHRRSGELRVIGDFSCSGDAAGKSQVGMNNVHRLIVQERPETSHHLQLFASQDWNPRGAFDRHPTF